MDLQTLLPLFLQSNKEQNPDFIKLFSSLSSGKDKSEIFKNINPASLFQDGFSKPNPKRKPHGLTPISDIAGNLVIGMIARYFSA